MNFLILVIVLCFFISLYVVYLLSHDDFVILRNDVSMEKIFNASFIFAISGLFVSRLIYVIFHPSNIFHSILGFILFPYFPGLSMVGSVLGGFGLTYFYLRSKNLPVGRILDFFSIAFLVSFPIGFIGYLILLHQKLSAPFYISVILSCILLFIFVRFVLNASLGGKLRDGGLTLLFLASFSFFLLLDKVLATNGKEIVSPENGLSLILLIFSISFLVREGDLQRFIVGK